MWTVRSRWFVCDHLFESEDERESLSFLSKDKNAANAAIATGLLKIAPHNTHIHLLQPQTCLFKSFTLCLRPCNWQFWICTQVHMWLLIIFSQKFVIRQKKNRNEFYIVVHLFANRRPVFHLIISVSIQFNISTWF